MSEIEIEVLLQYFITGLSNGMIIALIALGYTMVYGIIELINFAHGDLFMLGGFMALTLVGLLGLSAESSSLTIAGGLAIMLVVVPIFCAALNWSIDRLAYKPLRHAPKLAPLVAAIGVSFILMNLGMFWGGLPMDVFGGGTSATAAKDFPDLISNYNFLGEENFIRITAKDLMVYIATVPLMIGLTCFVRFTRTGKAMRAVAQNPMASQLMGIDVNRIIGMTFIIGGALAGAASVINALYANSIKFQMGYQSGMDAFTAAVLGGIGNLPGAMLGGLVIGVVRAMTTNYIGESWINAVVFGVLILVLVFKPTGLLGTRIKEKV